MQKWTHHLVHNLQTCPFLFTVFMVRVPIYICAWKISCATQALLGPNRLILMYFQSIKDPLPIPRAWCSDSLTFKQSYIIVHPRTEMFCLTCFLLVTLSAALHSGEPVSTGSACSAGGTEPFLALWAHHVRCLTYQAVCNEKWEEENTEYFPLWFWVNFIEKKSKSCSLYFSDE